MAMRYLVSASLAGLFEMRVEAGMTVATSVLLTDLGQFLHPRPSCKATHHCHHISSQMDGPSAVRLNHGDVDLNQTCVFDYSILGRRMQHMQLNKLVNRIRRHQAFQGSTCLSGFRLFCGVSLTGGRKDAFFTFYDTSLDISLHLQKHIPCRPW